MRIDQNGIFSMGEEDFFLGERFIMASIFFGNADDIDRSQAEFLENIEDDIQLPFAPIDNHQIAKVIFFFGFRKMSMDDFAHSRIIVSAFDFE